MQLVLEVLSGANSGQKIVLQPGTLARIGRRKPADFVFAGNAGMSGLHFSVESSGDAWIIRDLNSTNGTWLNGQRVADGVFNDGDEIVAGEARFAVHIALQQPVPASGLAAPTSPGEPVPLAPAQTSPSTDSSEPETRPSASVLAASPVASTATVPSPKDRLLAMLRSNFQPLYAVLDGARSPDIYKLLAEARSGARQSEGGSGAAGGQPTFHPPGKGTIGGGGEYESLYEGQPKAQLVHFAPYLVSLPPDSSLLERLVRKSWGKSWGIYLTSDLDFADVRRHLRRFLMVRLPDERQVIFRFYDPRVLRVYLPTCLPEEVGEFFGTVKYYLMEDDKPGVLLRFSNALHGVGLRKFPLVLEEGNNSGLIAGSAERLTHPPGSKSH
jgi:Domain of unknown function (DUF4123)/FHA domain